MPLANIDDTGKELCRRLLFDERTFDAVGNCIEDPLQMLIEHYADKKAESKKGQSLGDTSEARLKQAIIQGRRESLFADLDQARQTYSPIDIINKILLDGMKVVGDLFGAGQMQLPFVLQSAEVMKASVAYLEQFMEKAEGQEKGKIVLATVKGDVHDIGKNLVDIILTNNGYKVFNLGIKQPIENMIAQFEKNNADAIGMSGLLVKSTVIMREDLVALNERHLNPPVILGGAALNRRYVEQDLRAIYKGPLFYGEDAFDGLRIMDQIVARKRIEKVGSSALKGVAEATRQPHLVPAAPTSAEPNPIACCPTHQALDKATRRGSTVVPAPNIPAAPFWGTKTVIDIKAEELFAYINERTLIGTQWQFRKNNVDPREYERQMQEVAYPALERLKKMCLAENIMRPAVVYGYFPAASEGNDLIVFEDDGRTERLRFSFPRQDHGDFLCLSDFFLPINENSGAAKATDVVSLFGVTMGHEVSRRAKELFDADRYMDYLYLHGLGVEMAEGLAELFHRQLRSEWGIGADDATTIPKLFKKHYRGCRYAFGYPACPRLEDQAKLFQLLNPERIGLYLSDQFQLEPEQSTTAIVAHHPEARYFNVTR
jgi:5-methyltetrahydrofolate--homocysteine methyltransferase